MRHIQTNEQLLNWEFTNVLNKIQFLFGDKYSDILGDLCSF